MTKQDIESRMKRLEELRQAYKNAKTESDRKIIEIRGKLLKRSIKTLV